ncbi:MAG: hypothetical protein Q8P44_05915 [Dehalococcoidia bacterium]|nr:hypothetical protein [Dehalococcoidia bacterium]
MQVPESIRKHLAQEFKFAADQIRATPDLHGKLYFFSAFFGETGRALNADWIPDIALLHLVLQSLHGAINMRLITPIMGTNLNMGLPKDLAEALTTSSAELADLFQTKEINEKKLYQLIVKFAELAYVATGNGYYLYLRGAIKV